MIGTVAERGDFARCPGLELFPLPLVPEATTEGGELPNWLPYMMTGLLNSINAANKMSALNVNVWLDSRPLRLAAAETINVLSNDSNPLNENLTVSLVGTGTHGDFVNNGNGTITYTMTDAFFSGSDSINYNLCNSNNTCSQAIITISGPNKIIFGGKVFYDTNGDQNNAGDAGYNNVKVALYKDINGDGLKDANDTWVADDNTDNNGNYSFTINTAPAVGSTQTFSNLAINASNNDSYQLSNGSNVPSAYEENNITHKGFRFTSLNIPANATITNAKLKLIGYSGGGNSVTVKAEYNKSPGAYSSANNYLSTRNTTTSSVNWSLPSLNDGTTYTSPDLKSIVQQVVNDKTGVTHLSLILSAASANWVTWNFDDGEKFPKLDLTYTTPGNPGKYVAVVDVTTLPLNYSFTTDNKEVATFSSFGQIDCDNNFGFNIICDADADNTTTIVSITESETKTLTGLPAGGSWSIVSGGGSITGSTYTPANINTNTTVKIRYTIAADGACVATTDDVTFTVTPVCAVASNTTSTTSITELQTKSLEGSPSGGTWSIVSGGGTISGATNPAQGQL